MDMDEASPTTIDSHDPHLKHPADPTPEDTLDHYPNQSQGQKEPANWHNPNRNQGQDQSEPTNWHRQDVGKEWQGHHAIDDDDDDCDDDHHKSSLDTNDDDHHKSSIDTW